MAKENFSELSTEDLIKKKKTTTFVAGILIGALIMLLIITISKTINEGITPSLAVPIPLLPILIICYIRVRSMNKELENRKSN